jgi:septal ring-binding cell division protein DamX
VQAKAESKAKAVTQTGERFSANNASQYVVQIVTLGSAKAVSTFIKTHDLKDCHSFRQQRDGKELFSLTCGLYPSREAALAAQSSLPSTVSAAKPYPRQIADIRKVMLP